MAGNDPVSTRLTRRAALLNGQQARGLVLSSRPSGDSVTAGWRPGLVKLRAGRGSATAIKSGNGLSEPFRRQPGSAPITAPVNTPKTPIRGTRAVPKPGVPEPGEATGDEDERCLQCTISQRWSSSLKPWGNAPLGSTNAQSHKSCPTNGLGSQTHKPGMSVSLLVLFRS